MILDLSFEEVCDYVQSLGEPKFRAKQLYEALTMGKTLDEISNLPKSFSISFFQTNILFKFLLFSHYVSIIQYFPFFSNI